MVETRSWKISQVGSFPQEIPSLKQTARTWKCMVRTLISFWDGLFFWGYVSFKKGNVIEKQKTPEWDMVVF